MPIDRGAASMAGCVAVAMAQIIHHWQYPDSVTLPNEQVTWTTHQLVQGHTLLGGSYNKSDASIPSISYPNLMHCKAGLTWATGFSAETIYTSKVSLVSLETAAEAFRNVWGYDAEYYDNADGMLLLRDQQAGRQV